MRTGPWVKADPSEKDGFYCGNPKCGHKIEYKDKTIIESMLKECRLDRPPIPDFDYKANEILEDLNNMKNVADGVEIKKEWRRAKEADRSSKLNFESLGIPNEILNAIKISPAFGIDIAKDLYSHQVEAIEEALSHKNIIVTTPTASGKSICYCYVSEVWFIIFGLALARISSDVFVQTKGFGHRFHTSRYALIPPTSEATESNELLLSAFLVKIPNHISIIFIHEADVGVK